MSQFAAPSRRNRVSNYAQGCLFLAGDCRRQPPFQGHPQSVEPFPFEQGKRRVDEPGWLSDALLGAGEAKRRAGAQLAADAARGQLQSDLPLLRPKSQTWRMAAI